MLKLIRGDVHGTVICEIMCIEATMWKYITLSTICLWVVWFHVFPNLTALTPQQYTHHMMNCCRCMRRKGRPRDHLIFFICILVQGDSIGLAKTPIRPAGQLWKIWRRVYIFGPFLTVIFIDFTSFSTDRPPPQPFILHLSNRLTIK